MPIRNALLLWHRWFGLIAALWLLLLAVTGSLIVFYDEIDRSLNPDLRSVAIRAGTAPLDDIRASVEAYQPGSALDYLMLPQHSGDSILAFVGPRLAPGAKAPDDFIYRQIYVDPHDGRILGTRIFGEAGLDRRRLAQFLYQLHMDLSLGPVATWLLGLLALLWTLDHIVSALLSFPSPRRWRESFRIRRGVSGYKRHFDLHRAIGLWLFPVTLMLAISGLSLTWSDTFDAAVDVFSPTSGFPTASLKPLARPDHAPALSLDRAIALAERQAGGQHVQAISLHPDLGVYWLRLFDPRDLDDLGRRWILLRYADGAILSDRHVTQGSAGDVFTAWMFPLHSGKAFGWTGRIAIALSGLALSLVIVTGVTIWARKRRARAQVAGRTTGRWRMLRT